MAENSGTRGVLLGWAGFVSATLRPSSSVVRFLGFRGTSCYHHCRHLSGRLSTLARELELKAGAVFLAVILCWTFFLRFPHDLRIDKQLHSIYN
jgi:hypothetical protein